MGNSRWDQAAACSCSVTVMSEAFELGDEAFGLFVGVDAVK